MNQYQRDWQAAPHDPLAEAVVLNAFALVPDRIAQYPEVGEWLWDWKHKALWRAMVQVAGPISPDAFAQRTLDALQAREPKAWADVWHSTMNAVEARVEHVSSGGEFGSFMYWLARLERFHEARRLVSQAQDIATHAWRGDVRRANAALGSNRNTFRNNVPVSLADSILEF